MKECEVDEERIKTVDIRALHIAIESETGMQSKSPSKPFRREVQVSEPFVAPNLKITIRNSAGGR